MECLLTPEKFGGIQFINRVAEENFMMRKYDFFNNLPFTSKKYIVKLSTTLKVIWFGLSLITSESR